MGAAAKATGVAGRAVEGRETAVEGRDAGWHHGPAFASDTPASAPLAPPTPLASLVGLSPPYKMPRLARRALYQLMRHRSTSRLVHRTTCLARLRPSHTRSGKRRCHQRRGRARACPSASRGRAHPPAAVWRLAVRTCSTGHRGVHLHHAECGDARSSRPRHRQGERGRLVGAARRAAVVAAAERRAYASAARSRTQLSRL
jgi:hypothetical protein